MKPFFSAFVLSLALNGVFFASMDKMVSMPGFKAAGAFQARNSQSAKKDILNFEFVESPKKLSPGQPRKTPKISDQDSVARDLEKIKSPAARSLAPKMETQGAANQLAQSRGKGVSVPQSPVSSKARPEIIEQKLLDTAKAGQDSKNKETAKAPENVSGLEGASKIQPIVSEPKKIQEISQKTPQQSQKPSAAAAAQPMNQSGGTDRITTQAMTRSRSSGARLYGATSFEATGSGMGEYMKNLKERIWLAWFPYLAFQYPMDFKGADALISFTLDKKGEVKIVRVIQSSGSEVFASFCVESVQRASGFGPLPEEILALLGKDELEIRFAFYYR